jgi:hypothetical protein
MEQNGATGAIRLQSDESDQCGVRQGTVHRTFDQQRKSTVHTSDGTPNLGFVVRPEGVPFCNQASSTMGHVAYSMARWHWPQQTRAGMIRLLEVERYHARTQWSWLIEPRQHLHAAPAAT